MPPENKLIYRVVNRIRYKTHDPVIMRELLFQVGDRYNPALVAETERNLRSLPFIRHAEAEPTVNKDGTVSVIVRTYDSWTLELVANYKRAGGSTSVKAGLSESNILGEGKVVSAVYSRDWGAESRSFNYQDLQFLRYKHLLYTMAARTAPGSQDFSLFLARPFYASLTPYALGGNLSYSAIPSTSAVTRRTAEAGISYGISLSPTTERTHRINFGLVVRRAQSSGPVADPERSAAILLSADWEDLDYLTARRIQKFTHDEDFNLGLGVSPALAWAPAVRSLGTTRTQFTPSITIHKGFTWGDQLLLLKSGYTSMYVNGGNGNRTLSFDAAYYLRGIRYQTLAVHTSSDIAWRLDPAAPLLLGEFNGLRGYGVGQFAGDRRFLLNIEDRVYVWDDLFRVMDVGMVFFSDSGYVWPDSKHVKLTDLRNSVGVGLRVAPSRSTGNDPVRIDLAHGLNGSQSRSTWMLSILGGQAF